MKVIDHMAAIPEGGVLESNNILSPYSNTQTVQTSRPSSPLLSPTKSRRIQNILHGLKTPLSASKSSIDGFKVGSQETRSNSQQIHMGQCLNGVGISKSGNYVENWVSEQNTDCGDGSSDNQLMLRLTSMNSSDATSSQVATPGDEKSNIFVMDMEDERVSRVSRQASEFDLKNMCLENPDVTRVRHIESGSNPRRFTVAEYGNSSAPPPPVNTHDTLQQMIDANRAEMNLREADVNKDSGMCAIASTGNASSISVDTDVPEIVIDCASSRGRHCSGSSKSSASCGSIPSYDPPESNQSTVTSLTPLIPTSGSSPNLSV